MTIETDCTVLCSMLYTRSCLNLIGWFQVTATLRYMLGWIPVGLSSSCVDDSLCQTMKWASAGAVEGVHGMLFQGCGHISHRTASLYPSPLQPSLQPRSTHTPPHCPWLVPCIKFNFCSSTLLAEHRRRGSGRQSRGRCGHPFPCSINFNFCSSALLAEHRKGGQGGSPRGDVATSLGKHSKHTFHCSCTGPFHGLTQAVDYTWAWEPHRDPTEPVPESCGYLEPAN